jgi:2-oxoglutarate ferredoxin oxidoreductase subunit gamma
LTEEEGRGLYPSSVHFSQAHYLERTLVHEIIISGVGGQGIMVIGNLLAHAAFIETQNVTYLPIYGVEKRGGQADCYVVISSEEIGSPVIGLPQSCIIMSRSSLDKYVPKIKLGGLLLLNSSFVEPREVARNDLTILAVPAMKIAKNLGNGRLGNMVVIGAFVEKTKIVSLDALTSALSQTFEEQYHHLLPANAEAIRRGAEYARTLAQESEGSSPRGGKR